ncbi:MAG TPA: hypothetical protein PKU85_02300 [Bacteroidales bacterium]|nr:MAG: hypothetical protein BWX62_00078 [Bacteroidetes bacterium ADurb.Bin037]HPV88030.1 hypothetical protein [Bacteroidales bacterium]HPW77956.1 hypothetical protein [Bacteroidales bacterium]HQB55414.1 hypothetical protein [Bacteroidales bacterium]
MKKTLTVILCLMALGSCRVEQEPQEVARAFLESFFVADYQTARTYAAPELYHVLERSQAIMDSLTEEEREMVKNHLSAVKITIDIPEKIKRDTLRLPYRIEFYSLPEPDVSVIALRRERKIWRVFSLD